MKDAKQIAQDFNEGKLPKGLKLKAMLGDDFEEVVKLAEKMRAKSSRTSEKKSEKAEKAEQKADEKQAGENAE